MEDGMVERSPVAGARPSAVGSTCGWQDRPLPEQASVPGAFHPSALHVVAFLAADHPFLSGPSVPRIEGPGDARGSVIREAGVAAVTVPASARPATPDEPWARWTARRLAAWHRADAALAATWGHGWHDERSARAWISTHALRLLEELEMVRGRLELVVMLPAIVGPAIPAGDDAGPGLRWLASRAVGRAAVAESRARASLAGPLRGLRARSRRCDVVADDATGIARVRLLLDAADVAGAQREAVEGVRRGHIARTTGPWVPAPPTTLI